MNWQNSVNFCFVLHNNSSFGELLVSNLFVVLCKKCGCKNSEKLPHLYRCFKTYYLKKEPPKNWGLVFEVSFQYLFWILQQVFKIMFLLQSKYVFKHLASSCKGNQNKHCKFCSFFSLWEIRIFQVLSNVSIEISLPFVNDRSEKSHFPKWRISPSSDSTNGIFTSWMYNNERLFWKVNGKMKLSSILFNLAHCSNFKSHKKQS